jgi:hypothetical protein
MAYFYLHLHNGDGWTYDAEGQDHPNVRSAEYQAEKVARALVAKDIAIGLPVLLNSYIAVHDETGHEVARVSYAEVATFV